MKIQWSCDKLNCCAGTRWMKINYLYTRIIIILGICAVLYLLFFCIIAQLMSIACTKDSSTYSFRCFDKANDYKIAKRGHFTVLYNYIRADKWFRCHESITLTTTTDPLYLDNLRPLVERWQGPISVCLYTPGTDLETALSIIKYLRKCDGTLISKYVSFHLFFESNHRPKFIPKPADVFLEQNINCMAPAPWHNLNASQTYRSQKKLRFPINLGRNIARDAATTHYILANDIELYPSANIIPDFLKMMRRKDLLLHSSKPKVFVLPPFEVLHNASPPFTKHELVKMLKEETAVVFQSYACVNCHTISHIDQWIKTSIRKGMHVLHTSKHHVSWEPFYIGTNAEPYFDERLTWEHSLDKIIQGHTMCVLDYDFHILDNAFLVHRPEARRNLSYREFDSINTMFELGGDIESEIRVLFGMGGQCRTFDDYWAAICAKLRNNSMFSLRAFVPRTSPPTPRAMNAN